MKSKTILLAENISKQYRLGIVGTGTISHDLNRWWSKIRGKEDPYLKVGDANDRSTKGESNYVWALKDISFELNEGEVLGIIGKNGAGKSTLLKILSRVTNPTTGEIKTKGRIASLLEVGTGFHPELTGRENIYLNGAILGMTKSEIKLKEEEIIDFSGCERYVDTPVKRYSSGMRVRLAFAVAAHLEPDILVIDEVLAVGDAEFQKKAIGKMQDISNTDGRTVLFVSHNMAAVKNLCTRAIVLEHGKIAFTGPTDEAINFYLANNKSYSDTALIDRIDRTGNGDFLFKNFTINNFADEQQARILSGELYTFRIAYVAIKTVSNVSIRVRVLDSKGQIRFLLNNYFIDLQTLDLPETKHGEMMYTIEKMPLPKGVYTIQLTCFSDGYLEDDIENAFEFNVIGGDFYNSGREQISKEGVLIDHKFKLLD
jgi:lipopolysaccharide transport system ATP-binding protein